MSIDEGLTTGKNCRFECFGDGNTTLFIGRNVEMNDNVHITATNRVSIGNNVLIASKVYISDTSHGSYNGIQCSSPDEAPSDRSWSSSPIEIGDRVWLGENVSVLPGSRIGKGCIVGANSVVKSYLPDNSIVVGTPARIIKRYDNKLKQWIKY